MLKYLVVLPLFLSTTLAQAMTFQERKFLPVQMEAAIKTMQQKYLPAKLVKNTLAQAKGTDAAILKTALKSWPKHFSKDIGYVNLGNGISFSYKGVSLLSMQVTSRKPYTVLLNGRREVVMNKKGEGLASLRAALRAEGFGPAGSKSAWYDLLPKAVAAEASKEGIQQTFENSIILTSSWTSKEPAAKSTPELVKDGFLLPDNRYGITKAFSSRDETMQCNGDTATGKMADEKGQTLEFKATRSGGIEIVDTGVTIKGANAKASLEAGCGRYTELPDSENGKAIEKVGWLEENTKHKYVQQHISQKRQGSKNSMRACLEKELVEASQYLDPRYNERAYRDKFLHRLMDRQYRRLDPYNDRIGLPPEIEAIFHAKCSWEYDKKRRTPEFIEETKRLSAEAEASWPKDSADQLRLAVKEELQSILRECQSAQSLVPGAKLTCDQPSNVGEAKALCAQLDKAVPRVPTEFQACFEDKNCEPLDGFSDRIVNIREDLEGKKAWHKQAAQFQEKYKKHIKNGTLTEDAQGFFRIAKPNNLSGKEISEIGDAIAALVDARSMKAYEKTSSLPDEDYDKPKANLRSLVTGAMGLLDCCHDVECKQNLAKQGINLTPTQPGQDSKGVE